MFALKHSGQRERIKFPSQNRFDVNSTAFCNNIAESSSSSLIKQHRIEKNPCHVRGLAYTQTTISTNFTARATISLELHFCLNNCIALSICDPSSRPRIYIFRTDGESWQLNLRELADSSFGSDLYGLKNQPTRVVE